METENKWTLWIKIWTPEIVEDEDDFGTYSIERVKPAIHKIEGSLAHLQDEYNDIALAGEDGVCHEILALLDSDGYEITNVKSRFAALEKSEHNIDYKACKDAKCIGSACELCQDGCHANTTRKQQSVCGYHASLIDVPEVVRA